MLFPFAAPGESSEAAGFVLRPTPGGFTLRTPDGTTLEFDVTDVAAVARPRKLSRGTWSIALEHDPHGRLVRMADAGGAHVVTLDYVGNRVQTLTDQIAAVTDPAGHRHTYRYDLRDALTEVHHAGQLVESYKYDRAGNLTAKHDARGELLVAYTYGADGLKSLRRLADGEEHRYTYTPAGQFARIDWSGRALEFAYTGSGRRRRDLRDDRGVEHTFLGDRLTATTVLGRFTTRYRRIDARTLEIGDPVGNVHRLVLEPHGVVTRHMACGAREIAQVNSRGRVLEKHLFPVRAGEDVWRRTLVYSAEGDLLAVKDSQRGERRVSGVVSPMAISVGRMLMGIFLMLTETWSPVIILNFTS